MPARRAPAPVRAPRAESGEVPTAAGRLEDRLRSAIARRHARGLLRSLRAPAADSADFSSNDYLGLARDPSFRSLVSEHAAGCGPGSTGSRLLSGHTSRTEAAEAAAKSLHGAEAVLLFNSGYAANVSLISCVPDRDDAIVHDELVHASAHDGMRASRASVRVSFDHNNAGAMIDAVRTAMKEAEGLVFVVVETVYSMDGDVAPIGKMLDLLLEERIASGREIVLVADEAHAGGLYGPHGAGVCHPHARHPALLARIVTLGKAFGTHGAFVLCSPSMRTYLLNYARPLIYSTALPPHAVAAVQAAYEFARTDRAAALRRRVWRLRDRFRKRADERLPKDALLESDSPIQGVLVPGNASCVAAAEYIRGRGFEVYPIRSPTVPRGEERIRVVVHAHNTDREVDGVVEAIREALEMGKLAAI